MSRIPNLTNISVWYFFFLFFLMKKLELGTRSSSWIPEWAISFFIRRLQIDAIFYLSREFLLYWSPKFLLNLQFMKKSWSNEIDLEIERFPPPLLDTNTEKNWMLILWKLRRLNIFLLTPPQKKLCSSMNSHYVINI